MTFARLKEKAAEIFELDASRGEERILSMEGIRGLAVFLVFLTHYNGLFKPWLGEQAATYPVSHFLGSVGNTGVDLFFVLSGYLIYGAVLRKPVNFARFYRRRAQRIYPAFLAVFAIYLALSCLLPKENKIPAGFPANAVYVVENLLLLPGLFPIEPIITVAWSLSYEIFYYLTIPILVGALHMRAWLPRQRCAFFILLTAAFTLLCAGLHLSQIRLIMFISGILLYESLQSFKLGKRITKDFSGWVILALAFGFSSAYLLVDQNSVLKSLPGVAEYGGKLSILILFVVFFFLTLICFGTRSRLGGCFSWAPLRYLGNMSYSYYLLHGLTLKGLVLVLGMVHLLHPLPEIVFWAGLVAAFGVTCLVCSVLFITVEKPFSLIHPVKIDAAQPSGLASASGK